MAAKRRKKGTRRSSFNKRRKGLLSIVIPWMRRFGIALAFCIGIIWISSWLYLSGTLSRAGDWMEDKILLATADMGFAVENIMVEGREYTDRSVLLAIINVEKGDPLFSFNPKEAQSLIARIGWVESALVERRWPDTIYIGLKERAPLALWQTDKHIKLLDKFGKIIITDRLERFAGLVMVIGKDAPEHAPELIENLKAQSVLYERVETARRVGNRRWDLRLKNGIEIKLPEEELEPALQRLAKAQEENGLLDKELTDIDMRESDRISVKIKSGNAQDYQTNFKVNALAQSKAGNNI